MFYNEFRKRSKYFKEKEEGQLVLNDRIEELRKERRQAAERELEQAMKEQTVRTEPVGAFVKKRPRECGTEIYCSFFAY